MTARHPARSQLAAGQVVWLLVVTWSGRVYRFSTQAIDIETAAGEVLRFPGGLNDPEISEQTLEDLTVDLEGPSVPLEVVFPGRNIAAEWRAGRKLVRATAELAMVIADRRTGQSRQTWEARFEGVVGRVVQPHWGLPNRPVGWAAFSIEARVYDDHTPLLSPDWRISPATFTDAPDDAQGKAYPLVFGDAPGVYTNADGTASEAYVTPAYRINGRAGATTQLLVSVLATHVGRTKGTVDILEPESGTVFTADVSVTRDILLTPISVADISSAGVAFKAATEFWCCWNNGGGIVNPADTRRGAAVPGGALTRGADLLRFWLARTGQPIDTGAWEAIAATGNRVAFDGYVNDPDADIWEFCRDQLLPWMPLSVVRGPSGIVPIGALPTQPASMLPALTLGPGFALVSPERCARKLDEVFNDLTLEFALDRDGTPLDAQRIGPWPVKDRGGFTSDAAQASANEYQHRPAAARQADFIWSRSAARRALRWMVRLHGTMPTSIVVHAAPEYGWVRRGRWVALSGEGLSLSGHRAQCIGRAWIGKRRVWELTFRLEDDTLRRAVS